MASEVGSAFVSLLPSARGFSGRARRELKAALTGVSGDVKLDPSVSKADAAAAGRSASATAQAAARPIRLPVDVDRRDLSALVPAMASAGKALTVGVVGLTAIGAAGQAASAGLAGAASATAALIPIIGDLASVLAQAAGAALIVPGALAVGGAAFATLRLGVAGVGDALGEVGADAAEFEEAIQDLAPSAREFVRAVRDLKPAFDDLQLDVQQELFEGLGDEFGRLAERHLPALERGLPEIAQALGAIGRRGMRALAADQTVADLPIVLTNTRNVLFDVADAMAPLVFILRDIAVVGSSVFQSLTGGLGTFAREWADRVGDMRQSGELRDVMLDGLDALQQLGSALLDVFGIVRGIFSAAGDAGGGLFALLDTLNETVNSVAGQDALGGLFSELARIGDALQPVLLALVRGLGTVGSAIGDIAEASAPFLESFLDNLATALASLAPGFIALGPAVEALGAALVPVGEILSDLVVAMGPSIERFISALGEGLAALAPAAEPVGVALGAIIDAVTPLLPLLGSALANTLTILATIITGLVNGPGIAMIEVFAGIFDALHSALTPVLTDLAERLMPVFIEAGERIVTAFEPLIPVVAEVAELLAGELAEVMPELVEVFSELVLAFADMAGPIGQAVLDLILGLVPQLPELVDSGLALAEAILELMEYLIPLLPLLTEMLALVLQFVTPTVLWAMTNLIIGATHAIRGMATVLGALIAPIEIAIRWAGRFASAVGNAARTVTRWFGMLPGRIRAAVSGFGSLLVQAGRNLIGGLISGISQRFQDVRNTLGALTSMLPSWKGPEDVDRKLLLPAGRAIIQGLRRGLVQEIPTVQRTLTDLTANIGGMEVGSMDAAPVVVEVTGDGLDRALAAWLRSSVRVRAAGQVQRFAGARA